MDTKLKNRRKLFVVLWWGFLSVCVLVLIGSYYASEYEAADRIGEVLLVAAVAAWIFPKFQTFGTGEEKIFQAPLELVLFAAILDGLCSILGTLPWHLYSGEDWTGCMLMGGMAVAVSYWCSGCIRQMYHMGTQRVMKERLLTVRYGKTLREWFGKLYHSFDEIDFSEKHNRTIRKLVIFNGLILTLITMLWFVGIIAVCIYSVVLFFVIRKYFDDLKEKYARVLDATNQMAAGNLNVEISNDLGVFTPLKHELEKIQEGYQKAVDREVKSQKMKTELVTNVSHDLKTPLTAIITYVDLLKHEKDEEKRKEYITVLEKKSLRLKVLIEDLFEISKATTQNVTLEKTDVDLVNLFKQVKLELNQQFEKANLSFRDTFQEEKLICQLDSQKTYRIFENLLVNVLKYAMPGTRVYNRICREGEEAVIQILNVSAEEISVKAEDLTERFVRGDASRNTEGSGLGLAIARSFTELQAGRFGLTIEGDLFKVEVRFPVKNVDNSEKFA